jgi:hypothetical protein
MKSKRSSLPGTTSRFVRETNFVVKWRVGTSSNAFTRVSLRFDPRTSTTAARHVRHVGEAKGASVDGPCLVQGASCWRCCVCLIRCVRRDAGVGSSSCCRKACCRDPARALAAAQHGLGESCGTSSNGTLNSSSLNSSLSSVCYSAYLFALITLFALSTFVIFMLF